MSIVEKAIARLRSMQPAQAPAASAPSVEQAWQRAVPQAADVADTPTLPVDRNALVRAGLLPADRTAAGGLANELRHIKRTLLDNVAGRGVKAPVHARRMLVTSAVPGEGKTFTSINLAISLAHERDYEVLLVDGDIPKSDITRSFGLAGRPGLMDVLADESLRPADAIVRTDIAGLQVLPAGGRQVLAAELLGSLRMDFVLDQLAGQNARRLLVFDSPPLLATPEAQVMASRMGQVVVVVAAGHTTRQEVTTALQQLTSTQYVGLVLNKNRLASGESHYYGYYGRASGDHASEN